MEVKHPRTWIRLVSLVIVSGVVSTFASAASMTGRAPDFTLTTQDGTSVSLSELRGQVVMINF